MRSIAKYKRELALLLIIIAAYFLLRLPNLTLQPIFADEAIYIRWAQVMRAEPTLRFLPLSDGKTPLFMWTLMPLLKFIEDPLFAGRFLSVLSGLASLLGVVAISFRVFGKNVALWAGFIYTITPYTVFFDRMALVDSMLSALTVWALFFAILLAQKVTLSLAMILGFILGGAWLTKTPAVLNLLLLPTTILAFKKAKEDKYSLLKLFLFWLVAIFIALVMYNTLRLGPNFHLLSSRNADYVFSPLELVGRPLDPFIPHFRDIADWFPKLLTWPVVGLGFLGVSWVIGRKHRVGFIILLWAFIPLLLNMAFLRTFTARYLLPFIPLFIVFAGYGLDIIARGPASSVSRRASSLISLAAARGPLIRGTDPSSLSPLALAIILVIILYFPLQFNYQLLKSPPPKSLPTEERKGYFEEWTAGYGFSEIAKFLVEQKKQGNVVVGTEGFFGTLPDGLYIYLDKVGISVVGSTATISAELRRTAYDHKTFFVGNKKNLKNIGGVELVKEYPKVGSDATVLYRVLPQINN